jgi:hypothetical protein
MQKACLIIVAALLPFGVTAQERKPVKMLTPEECSKIIKKSDTEYLSEISVAGQRGTIAKGVTAGHSGVNPFDVITRSCFSGKAN